jgi:hypothetical protein
VSRISKPDRDIRPRPGHTSAGAKAPRGVSFTPANRHSLRVKKANRVSYSAQTRLVNMTTFWLGARRLQVEVAHAPSEYTMNIFYIIGVVVVVVIVAGYLGVHL